MYSAMSDLAWQEPLKTTWREHTSVGSVSGGGIVFVMVIDFFDIHDIQLKRSNCRIDAERFQAT